MPDEQNDNYSLIAHGSQPWESLGWFATVTVWIHEQLAMLGYTPSAPFEQVRTNFWSTALRVPMTRGNLYFKASVSVFAFEPMLTEALSRLVPAHVPPVLVVDRQQHQRTASQDRSQSPNQSSGNTGICVDRLVVPIDVAW